MDNPKQTFMDQLREGLQGKVQASKINQILAEAKNHLEESIEDLKSRGMTEVAATETAIQRFGDAEQVKTWYLSAHERPSVWKAARYPLLVLFSFLFVKYLPFFQLPYFISSMVLWINLTLIMMVIACYKSGRVTIGVQLGAIAICAIGYFAYFATSTVRAPFEHGYGLIPRGEVQDYVQKAKEQIILSEAVLPMLRKGQQLFASETEPSYGTEPFRNANGYLTPVHFQMQTSSLLRVFVNGRASDGIIPDWSLARQFWVGEPMVVNQRTGKEEIHYISETENQIYFSKQLINEIPLLVEEPWQKNLNLYWKNLFYKCQLLIYFAVVGDFLGGLIRFAREKSRSRRTDRMLNA